MIRYPFPIGDKSDVLRSKPLPKHHRTFMDASGAYIEIRVPDSSLYEKNNPLDVMPLGGTIHFKEEALRHEVKLANTGTTRLKRPELKHLLSCVEGYVSLGGHYVDMVLENDVDPEMARRVGPLFGVDHNPCWPIATLPMSSDKHDELRLEMYVFAICFQAWTIENWRWMHRMPCGVDGEPNFILAIDPNDFIPDTRVPVSEWQSPPSEWLKFNWSFGTYYSRVCTELNVERRCKRGDSVFNANFVPLRIHDYTNLLKNVFTGCTGFKAFQHAEHSKECWMSTNIWYKCPDTNVEQFPTFYQHAWFHPMRPVLLTTAFDRNNGDLMRTMIALITSAFMSGYRTTDNFTQLKCPQQLLDQHHLPNPYTVFREIGRKNSLFYALPPYHLGLKADSDLCFMNPIHFDHHALFCHFKAKEEHWSDDCMRPYLLEMNSELKANLEWFWQNCPHTTMQSGTGACMLWLISQNKLKHSEVIRLMFHMFWRNRIGHCQQGDSQHQCKYGSCIKRDCWMVYQCPRHLYPEEDITINAEDNFSMSLSRPTRDKIKDLNGNYTFPAHCGQEVKMMLDCTWVYMKKRIQEHPTLTMFLPRVLSSMQIKELYDIKDMDPLQMYFECCKKQRLFWEQTLLKPSVLSAFIEFVDIDISMPLPRQKFFEELSSSLLKRNLFFDFGSPMERFSFTVSEEMAKTCTGFVACEVSGNIALDVIQQILNYHLFDPLMFYFCTFVIPMPGPFFENTGTLWTSREVVKKKIPVLGTKRGRNSKRSEIAQTKARNSFNSAESEMSRIVQRRISQASTAKLVGDLMGDVMSEVKHVSDEFCNMPENPASLAHAVYTLNHESSPESAAVVTLLIKGLERRLKNEPDPVLQTQLDLALKARHNIKSAMESVWCTSNSEANNRRSSSSDNDWINGTKLCEELLVTMLRDHTQPLQRHQLAQLRLSLEERCVFFPESKFRITQELLAISNFAVDGIVPSTGNYSVFMKESDRPFLRTAMQHLYAFYTDMVVGECARFSRRKCIVTPPSDPKDTWIYEALLEVLKHRYHFVEENTCSTASKSLSYNKRQCVRQESEPIRIHEVKSPIPQSTQTASKEQDDVSKSDELVDCISNWTDEDWNKVSEFFDNAQNQNQCEWSK